MYKCSVCGMEWDSKDQARAWWVMEFERLHGAGFLTGELREVLDSYLADPNPCCPTIVSAAKRMTPEYSPYLPDFRDGREDPAPPKGEPR